MNLDAKITNATRCLQHEYPEGLDDATLDFAIAQIKREHRAQARQRLSQHVQSLVNTFATVARLMNAERLGMRSSATLGSQH